MRPNPEGDPRDVVLEILHQELIVRRGYDSVGRAADRIDGKEIAVERILSGPFAEVRYKLEQVEADREGWRSQWEKTADLVCELVVEGTPGSTDLVGQDRDEWQRRARVAGSALVRLADRLEHAEAEVVRLTRERDEADRRAGAAERQYESGLEALAGAERWKQERKIERGYSFNTSFDRVWSETCALADRTSAAEDEARRLRVRLTEASALLVRAGLMTQDDTVRPDSVAGSKVQES